MKQSKSVSCQPLLVHHLPDNKFEYTIISFSETNLFVTVVEARGNVFIIKLLSFTDWLYPAVENNTNLKACFSSISSDVSILTSCPWPISSLWWQTTTTPDESHSATEETAHYTLKGFSFFYLSSLFAVVMVSFPSVTITLYSPNCWDL